MTMPITTLVERDTELGVLQRALAGAAARRSAVLLIEGAAGCGKSELVEALARFAGESGAVVLTASGYPGEQELPFGVLRQLAQAAESAGLPLPAVDPDGPVRSERMRELLQTLTRAGERAPVVLAVDDLPLVDRESQLHLAHLVQYARTARLLLVLAGAGRGYGLAEPELDAALLRRADCRRVPARPLTPSALADLVEQHGYQPAAAAELHTLTGGNPLLVRARLADPGSPAEHQPPTGGLFARAVTECVTRSGPGALAAAQAVAVLGEFATPARVAELLDLTPSVAELRLALLEAAGVLADHRFRHQVGAAAVLDLMAAEERADLHRRAADLLRREGQPAPVVARHLLSAQRPDRTPPAASWAADVLCDLAEQLHAQDRAKEAAGALAAAEQACPDERRRDEIATRIAAVTWRYNPAAAERQLRGPLEQLRAGVLAEERLAPLAQLLMAQGRVEEALEVNQQLGRQLAAQTADPKSRPAPAVAGGQARASVWAVQETAGEPVVTEAERLLQSTPLTATTLLLLHQAVRTLARSDQPERSAPWCLRLSQESAERGAPGWAALFATVHAEVLLHLGELREAEQQAALAVDCLPQAAGSAFACAPLAALIRVRTALGRTASVVQLLDQPVPRSALESVHGVAYLRARGLHHLTVEQYQAALADFGEVGRLLRRWRLDRPLLYPWRTDAAEALLKLGERDQAERLVMQQLSAPDAQRPWVQGISLRLRAAVSERTQRPALLERAVDELRRSGDRIELARTLADLGQALQAVGETSRAGTTTRRAWNLAHACGAEGLRERILPGLASESHPVNRQPAVGSAEPRPELSGSQHRVAALAAQGYTNREIAMKLYVTVSTVEQHLTQIYRKLNITRRQDLPVELQLSLAELA
ncbi:AAA family ATPase [Kitasatospora sp. NPDC058965]|uniref:AAA family ATPase n=1 Tax=Kitasatospora sp. NPDC058965 TaxID=3346682 RepID=UPI0036A41361